MTLEQLEKIKEKIKENEKFNQKIKDAMTVVVDDANFMLRVLKIDLPENTKNYLTLIDGVLSQ